jgi:(p)ppGpp synthase/HD superfamily hydrolase
MEDWMKWIRETFENVSKEDNTSKQLIERLKLNLFADEIYCFTPKGELRVLPAGATPIDFAFEIHTEVGTKCIGAKVDGKIVTLDTPLKSGNQVEIITSKNQKPKLDWERFVVTHKAKSDIRRYFNSEKRRLTKLGREYFNKKIKKNKIHINEDSLQKIIHKLRFKDLNNFYHEAGQDTKNADNVIDILIDKTKMKLIEQSSPQPTKKKAEVDKKEISSFDKFIQDVRASGSVISLGGENESEISGLKYDYAKCCNPIPGDEVIGFITQTQGIKIHRKSCKNIVNLFLMDPDRILEINWREAGSGEFTGGIKIIGEDKPGMLNDITQTISENFKINIKNINIYTKGSMFEGTLIIKVENLKQLNAIIDRINKQEGVLSATRFEV